MSKQRTYQTLRGMRDILPQDQIYWDWVIGTAERLAKSYGFKRIETPIAEETELFRRSVGQDTDIVKKEMFSFKDQGGDNISLRPEITASILRAYIEHGLCSLPHPLKLFETGVCFRHEKPQAGRFRQFHQISVEVLGAAEPASDAEIIALAYIILKELGLEVTVQVNNIGTKDSRKIYIKKLKSFYQQKVRYLCDDCRSRFKTNPLRLLDCKKKKCNEFILEAPQIVDYLDEESSKHLVKLLEYLDEFDLSYVLNPRIVRGLDYYDKTAFEIWGKGESAEARTVALGGGGRYDGLLKLLGGRDTPALGFALGLERIIAQIREKNIAVPQEKDFDIFLAHIGEDARKKVLSIFENLRSKGYNITCNLSKSSLKQQLELADKEKVKITLILGEKEVSVNEILIKEMTGGEQESVAIEKLEKELEKRLK